MELLTVIKCPDARGHGGARPNPQLSVHVLYVCCVLLISAPFMHCVHHHSAEGFCTLVLFILIIYWLILRVGFRVGEPYRLD